MAKSSWSPGREKGRAAAWQRPSRRRVRRWPPTTYHRSTWTRRWRIILAAGGQVKAYVEDIAKKMPVQTLLNAVLDDFGRIDILVNCAEVEPQKSVLEMDDWDWQRTLDVNLNGAFLLTQSVGRIMKEKGGGVIVHVGERAKGPERRAAYFTSKAGLAALSALAAYELSEYGIRVYHVRPEETGDVVRHILELCG